MITVIYYWYIGNGDQTSVDSTSLTHMLSTISCCHCIHLVDLKLSQKFLVAEKPITHIVFYVKNTVIFTSHVRNIKKNGKLENVFCKNVGPMGICDKTCLQVITIYQCLVLIIVTTTKTPSPQA